MFVDRVSVSIRAGDGGNGKLSFRHEKFIDKGGPDGGDGGNGGNVILKASRNQNTLASFRYQKLLQAKHGQPGDKRKKHGKNGEDLVIDVPVGTTITDEGGTVLADLTHDGQSETVARGGHGGFGNAHFTSSTRQAPRIAENGEKGDGLDAILELKMIADVGIIGLPNAGKSTLLSVISNAKPEIADYPFTTLRPNLGIVDIDPGEIARSRGISRGQPRGTPSQMDGKAGSTRVDKKHSLLFADIPGLIEGASQGKGLGDEFLRHTERTAVLLHLIDAYNEDMKQAYKTIIKELADYKTDLSNKPEILAITKIEGMDKKIIDSKIKQLTKLAPKDTPVLAFSSNSKQGLDELMRIVFKEVQKHRAKAVKASKAEKLPVIGLKPSHNDWSVQKTKNEFIVKGRKIEKFASRTRFGDPFSEERLRDILKKTGVLRELERQDIKPGQKISIGSPAIGQLDY